MTELEYQITALNRRKGERRAQRCLQYIGTLGDASFIENGGKPKCANGCGKRAKMT